MNSPNVNTFGVRLERLLQEHGMTRMELSEAMRVAPSTINMFFVRGGWPSMETAVKIADVLSISLDELIRDNPPFPKIPSEWSQLLFKKREEYRNADAKTKQSIELFFQAFFASPEIDAVVDWLKDG